MTPIPYGPPAPIRLDGITFFNDVREHETAHRGSLFVGELDLDSEGRWCARKVQGAALSDWQAMRSAAEARAFIVSRVQAMTVYETMEFAGRHPGGCNV